MRCPFCGHPEDRVVDSRAGGQGDVIRRRRECESCAKRFTTYERIEETLPTVVKKDGRREPFDRQKLVDGLRVACKKRPVSADQIESLADRVERRLSTHDQREAESETLGGWVMLELRDIDEVAYVRFASVYRCFRDLDEFQEEVERLMRAKESGDVPLVGASPHKV
jgi:transcriptional repressor NrdR